MTEITIRLSSTALDALKKCKAIDAQYDSDSESETLAEYAGEFLAAAAQDYYQRYGQDHHDLTIE